MSVNFPANPTIGDVFAAAGRSWTWDGTAWNVTVPTVSAAKIQDADNDTRVVVEQSGDDDTIRFETAGVARATVGSDGTVTVFESAVLQSDASVAGDLTVDTDTFHVDSTNNRVGISTATPSSTLDVVGTLNVEGSASVDGLSVGSNGNITLNDGSAIYHGSYAGDFLFINDSGVSADGITMTGDLTVGSPFFGNQTIVTSDEVTTTGLTVDTDTLHVDSTNDRVGIGTTTPSYKLHISDSNPTIWLTDTDTNADSYVSASSSVGSLILSADENNEVGSTQMSFKVDGAERITVLSSGNVGINDTTPSYKLDVNGDINTTGAFRTDGNKTGLVLVGSADFTNVGSAEFRNTFTTEFDNYQLHISNVTSTLQEWIYFRGWYGATLLSTNSYDNQRFYCHNASLGGQKDVTISYGKFLPMGGNATSFVVNISSPMVSGVYTLTTAYGLYSDNSTLGYIEINNTFVRSTGQMDGIRFGGVSGSGTFSGRWELYGCPK